MEYSQDGKYFVEIVRRNLQQSRDDYHATVERMIDGEKLVFISNFKWLLKRKVRRKALDRAFKAYDKREKKLKEKDQYTV